MVCCFAVTGPVFIVLRTTPREMALIVDAKRGGGTVSLILSRVQTLDYCIYMLSILRFLVLLFEWQKRDSDTHTATIYTVVRSISLRVGKVESSSKQ